MLLDHKYAHQSTQMTLGPCILTHKTTITKRATDCKSGLYTLFSVVFKENLKVILNSMMYGHPYAPMTLKVNKVQFPFDEIQEDKEM